MPRAGDRPAVQPSLEAFHEPAVSATPFDEPAAPATAPDERPLFASSAPAPGPVSGGGMKIWLAAAASLVLGIAIGFASGYRSGQSALSGPASGAPAGQPFSESSVADPVRIEEKAIVPAPEPAASAPAAAGSAAVASGRRGTRPTGTAAPPEPQSPVGRVPPETRSIDGGPATSPPKTAPAGPGSIQVLSRPAGAQVTLDGRLIGKTPMLIPDVASGSHTIRLELASFNPWTTTVDVKSGDAVRVAASLEQ